MITVTMLQSRDSHRYLGFTCEGHADYAEEGEDIVCAAVSALTLNAANSIETLTDDAFEAEQAEDGGYLKVNLPNGASDKAQLLLESMALGLKSIQNAYGNTYSRLNFKEV